MDNFDLRKFVSEKTLLNENAPGYDTRKFGESLPTMESVKAAYEAKNDIKEDVSKAKELADKVLTVASEGIKDLNGSELMEFRALIAQSFDMIDEAKKEDITETRDLGVKEKMDNILYVMDPVQVIDNLLLAMSTDDANLYLDAIIQDHEIMMIDEDNLNEEIPGAAMLKINQSVKSVSTAAKAMIDFYNQMAEKEQIDFLKNQQFKIVMDKLNALVKEKDENDEM
jgi:hypothetical protein